MPSTMQALNPALVSNQSVDKGTASLSSTEKDEIDYGLSHDLAERLVQRTETRVAQVVSQSTFVRKNCTLSDIPTFDHSELSFGNMIAHGGFSNVHEIRSFNVDTPLLKGGKHASHYVIKHLNPKLVTNPKKLVVGAKDLVMEAHFLSALDHENVIKLRGTSASGIAGFAATGRADGFFLVLDRLGETLSRRITTWRDEAKCARKIPFKGRQCFRSQLFAERMQTAVDIASAVKYLHEQNIIYRDLKPANIGFDVDGTLKIFDFGLAVEIPASDDPNKTFNLAGNTGTSRYMAVEVIRKQHYNLKADVFSFSVLLWEIMALRKPYDGLVGSEVKESVSKFGERPVLPRSWPSTIKKLMKKGWSEVIPDRPTMDEVHQILSKVLESALKAATRTR